MPSRTPLTPLPLLALLCVALCARAAHAGHAASGGDAAPAARALRLPGLASPGIVAATERDGPITDAAALTTSDLSTADLLTDDDSGSVFVYGEEMLVRMTVNIALLKAEVTRLKRVTVTNTGTGQVHVLMDDFALTPKGKANLMVHTRLNDGKDVTVFTVRALVAGAPAEDPVFLTSHSQYVIDSIASVEYSGQERMVVGRSGLRRAGRRARDGTGRTDVLASTRITVRSASSPPHALVESY